MSIFRTCRHLSVVAAAFAAGVLLGAPAAHAQDGFTVVDTIAPLSLSTHFSVFGSGGQPIFSTSYTMSAGPIFSLANITTLTEVGAFLNNCAMIVGGIPQCPDTQPFFVEIHPVVNGQVQANVVASFSLSHDNDPLLVSYESATPNVTLDPGTYAAMFAARTGDAGFVLGNASDPVTFTAGSTQIAVFDGSNQYLSVIPFAVRITGEIVDPGALLSDLANAVKGVGPGRSLAVTVAAAGWFYAHGQPKLTCLTLTVFQLQVRAQSGKTIPTAQAAALIADANRIKTVLGCTK